MPLSRIASGLKNATARFVRAERGNVAIMYAITLPVLLTFIGAAIDYSRAVNARSAMQAAIDATALMVSKEATKLTAEEVTKKAQDYFKALYDRPEVGNVEIKAVYTPNSGDGASVKIDANGSMKTDFMKYAGYSDMELGASSTTKWGNKRYRVALALDNTGSMASANKMTELKNAANKLIENFAGLASTDADIYISIVPFSKDVNVGTSNKDATWIRWNEWEAVNGDCSGRNGDDYRTKSQCEDRGRTWTPDKRSTWNGCVMDRDKPSDTTSESLSDTRADLMAPAEQYGNCPVSILGMTPVQSAKQTLLDKVTAMKPIGNTNQSIGAFWAWMTLQQSGPFTAPPKDNDYSYQDVLILLTDGLNTENRWGGCNRWSCQVDDRQELLCTNLKKTNTMVFAVQVATDNDPVSTVTKNCASKPDYFEYITKASQITATFDKFFKELSRLRVAS